MKHNQAAVQLILFRLVPWLDFGRNASHLLHTDASYNRVDLTIVFGHSSFVDDSNVRKVFSHTK